MCDVFNSRLLPSSYGEQPREITVAYVLGTSGTSLTNNLALRFIFNNSFLLGTALASMMVIFETGLCCPG